MCLAGGTYDKRYWHIDIDGHPGYSFGEHLAKSGFVVIAVDHLGVGGSSDPTTLGPLGLTLLAKGDAEVVRQIRERLRHGEFTPGASRCPANGGGRSFDECLPDDDGAGHRAPLRRRRVAGYGVQITNVHERTADAAELNDRLEQTIEACCQLTGAKPTDTHVVAPRGYLASIFYAGEVPQEVINADTAVQSRVPLRAGA